MVKGNMQLAYIKLEMKPIFLQLINVYSLPTSVLQDIPTKPLYGWRYWSNDPAFNHLTMRSHL